MTSPRRDFIKTGLWAGSCLAFGLAAARREAEATGRPVLTEASFNQMMREAQASGRIKEMAAEASRDLKGWLQRNFSLTPVQAQRIQAMSPQAVQQISQTITPIAQKGGEIRLSMSERKRQDLETQKRKMQQEAAKLQKEAERRAEDAKDSDFFEKLIGVSARAADGPTRQASVTLRDRIVEPARQPAVMQQQKNLTPKEATR
jgi:hypothetical protein